MMCILTVTLIQDERLGLEINGWIEHVKGMNEFGNFTLFGVNFAKNS